MIRVELDFPKTSSGLAGFTYGKNIYQEQVAIKYTDTSETLLLVFPKNIKRVASSFVQGFFSLLIEEIGYEGIKERLKVEDNGSDLEKQILERIY